MKAYNYYRSPSRAPRKRPVRKKPSVSIIKPLILFVFLIALCVGIYWGAKKTYEVIKISRMGEWKPAEVVVSGIDGALAGEIMSAGQSKLKQPFSTRDAVRWQADLARLYPQFQRISVQRGLFSGKLKVSVKRRVPVAHFEYQNQTHFMDEDGAVYLDPHPDPLQKTPIVELVGTVPQNLGEEFAGFVRSVLKLKNQLHFTSLQFDLKTDTVTMHLPDGSVLHFGPAKKLRQKARRAAQIQTHAQQNGLTPYELDFTYFEKGKVFLRHKAH